MSSSGSWPSGCPEKYWWIGGEERPAPWYEQEMQDMQEAMQQEMQDDTEVTSRLQLSGQENMPHIAEIEIPPQDPRIQQMEDIVMELTMRLYAAEATAQRNDEELTRVNALNEELTARLASLYVQACRVWGQMLEARARAETTKMMFFAMSVVALEAVAKK